MQNMMVLLAHGSSDKQWAETFISLTASSRNKHTNIALAFMELNSPSLEDVALEAFRNNYDHITVLPLFLAKGKHLKHDIPNQLETLKSKYGIESKLLPPIGEEIELSNALDLIIARQIQQ